MTPPPSYSWLPRGERLRVPYEAAQRRWINAIGASFTQGPRAGHVESKTVGGVAHKPGQEAVPHVRRAGRRP